MASEENSMYAVLENGELARRRTAREKNQAGRAGFEHATGEKIRLRIAQERGHSIIKTRNRGQAARKNWRKSVCVSRRKAPGHHFVGKRP